ncbi:MAG: MFS transporter [Arenicellales bacterium WSBS_2016_MAG_OTU3]
MVLIAMVSIYNMALIALMSMTPLYMQNDLAYSPATVGLLFAGSMLIGSLLQPLIGRWSDTLDRHIVFISGSALAIVCSAVAAISGTVMLVVVALVINMAVLVAIRSGVLATAVDYASTRAATTLGFVFVVLMVGAGQVPHGYRRDQPVKRVCTLRFFHWRVPASGVLWQ